MCCYQASSPVNMTGFTTVFMELSILVGPRGTLLILDLDDAAWLGARKPLLAWLGALKALPAWLGARSVTDFPFFSDLSGTDKFAPKVCISSLKKQMCM